MRRKSLSIKTYNMRRFSYIGVLAIAAGFAWTTVAAQAAKGDLVLTPGYVSLNNKVQYLKVTAKTKMEGRFRPVGGVAIRWYITDTVEAHKLGEAMTSRKGEAMLPMPPAARDEWRRGAKVNFIVVSAASAFFDAVSSNLEITKARISIDTTEGKKVVARVEELKDSAWTPVKGVDVRMAVRRLDGDLAIGDAATYTTDSLGMATGEFKRDSLPGDAAGRLTLVASVDDNDSYGSLSIEKVVEWGGRARYVSHFDERSLFARRGRSPIWFELMAYGIIVAVWGVLLYLLLQIRKLRQLGNA